ncbi:MAG: DUF692 family protein [bacterium]|nr:DUF692 family protein [Myxococcales bacterium]MCB9550745.1 DUF692 family protein [Myxococcales bacterium]
MRFEARVERLPRLGIGVSTEYGAHRAPGALDLDALRREHPRYAGFLEVGVEADRGIDDDARRWVEAGGRTTYHFLDVNLDEPEDLDPAWMARVRAHAATLRPAWMCGDAGLWHFGRRERGHMLLLPPVLCDDAARSMAEGVIALREATGYEVLPENPPGHVYLGDLHLLDFYARLCDYADTGMLLDAAHLAIYQRACGHGPLTGLDGFPAERVVELHVAGATTRTVEGLAIVEDDHTPAVLPDTWAIVEAVAPRARALRAVVFECERNPLPACLPGFARIEAALAGSPFAAAMEENA